MTDSTTQEDCDDLFFNPVTREIVIDVYFYRKNLGQDANFIGREIYLRLYDRNGNEQDDADMIAQIDDYEISDENFSDESYRRAERISRNSEAVITENLIRPELDWECGMTMADLRKLKFRFNYQFDYEVWKDLSRDKAEGETKV